VVLLEHRGAALAQLLHLRVEGVGDDTDEACHDDQTTDGHDEHGGTERCPLIAAHGAGVESAHEARPERLAEAEVGVIARLDVEQAHDDADDEYEGEGRQGQQADEGDDTPRHHVVEPVAEAIRQGDFLQVVLRGP
jgi:hypothetical protein